jgi:pilus assembly protein Flp/PilA
MQNVEKRRKREERGASLVEYALLIGLIAIVSFAGVKLLGQHSSTSFSDLNSQIGG